MGELGRCDKFRAVPEPLRLSAALLGAAHGAALRQSKTLLAQVRLRVALGAGSLLSRFDSSVLCLGRPLMNFKQILRPLFLIPCIDG